MRTPPKFRDFLCHVCITLGTPGSPRLLSSKLFFYNPSLGKSKSDPREVGFIFSTYICSEIPTTLGAFFRRRDGNTDPSIDGASAILLTHDRRRRIGPGKKNELTSRFVCLSSPRCHSRVYFL